MTKTKSNEFKTMISQMEQDAMSDKHKCTRTCNKIRTNYAKDKKKHKYVHCKIDHMYFFLNILVMRGLPI